MDKNTLLNSMRSRLMAKSLMTKEEIASVSDDMLIDAYTYCSECGCTLLPEGASVEQLIADAADEEDFFGRLYCRNSK